MANSIRTIKAFSEKQTVALRYFSSLGEVEGWLGDLGEVGDSGGIPYYLHIDQFQVLPLTKEGSYPVFAIYHRVYLKSGE